MRLTRRQLFVRLTLGVTGVACSSPTEISRVVVKDDYEVSLTAVSESTVTEALERAGYELETDSTSWLGLGVLIKGINGRKGHWRIDVKGRWFGLDAARKTVGPGDHIGCWRV